tara:strand:- start:454 stop:804 length:351 start_codon:yes stop_codon:yes gene_type:complete
MAFFKGIWLAALWAVVFFGYPAVSKAQYPALPGKQTKCDEIKDTDRRNLCLAVPQGEIDPSVSFGYKRKDHSNYYCTLIGKRDLQNLCWAVVGPNKSKCGLIVDKKLEEECLAQFK